MFQDRIGPTETCGLVNGQPPHNTADVIVLSQSARAGESQLYSPEHIALLADALTAQPPETRMYPCRTQSLTDKTQLREHARTILAKLEIQAAFWLTHLNQHDPTTRRVTRAISDGNHESLAELGIDVTYAWLDDIMTAAITGAPTMGIETVGPYAMHHITDSGLETRINQLPNDEKTGLLLAGAFRDAFATCPNIRSVALIDDLTSNVPGRELSQAERNRYVVAMADIFRVFGAIRSDDTPGKEYLLIRESELLDSVGELIERLREADTGRVEDFHDEVIFYPTDAFMEKLPLHSANRRREFRRRGILLKRQGRPTCQALEAASFLFPVSKSTLNVTMLDRYFESQQNKTYALVRALGITSQDRYHNVFYDAERLPPELVVYAVCELLAEQTRQFLTRLDLVNDWERFDLDEYLTRNYGKPLPEDRGIIEVITEQLAKSRIPLASVKLVADVGAGPNLYPAMLMAPYVTDDGGIDLIEYGSANRSYLQDLMAQPSARRGGGIWHKFEELMIGTAGDHYLGALHRICQLGNTVAGSVYSLPRNRYDIVTSCFVAESITASRREFRLAIRSLASCVKPEGLLIVAHILGASQWQTGEGITFPAVKLSIEMITEAYRDADMAFTLYPLSRKIIKRREDRRGGGHKQNNNQEQEMVVVIARREGS